MGAYPQKLVYFVKCKNDANATEINGFLYQYMEYFVFLEAARKGALTPNPPKSPTANDTY